MSQRPHALMFKCHKCPYETRDIYNFKRHLDYMHDLNDYSLTVYEEQLTQFCRLCHLRFPNIRSCQQHRKKHHPTADEIVERKSKIAAEKARKREWYQAKKLMDDSYKVIETQEQKVARVASMKEDAKAKDNTHHMCDHCDKTYQHKNYNRHRDTNYCRLYNITQTNSI